MTKGAALQAFFSRFMDAYAVSAVPDDVTFPYLTYDNPTSSFGSGETSMTVNLWFYTTSEAVPNAKAEEISKALANGGERLKCDSGYIWLYPGSPFCQSIKDETDPHIKGRYLNITRVDDTFY